MQIGQQGEDRAHAGFQQLIRANQQHLRQITHLQELHAGNVE